MALVDKVGTGEVVSLDPATLKPGPKVRSERLDLDNVALIEPVVEECPPITVAYPSMTIVDGHHRQVAATRRKLPVRAVLVSLSSVEIYERAVKANIAHGLTLTIEERRANARHLLSVAPDWSDRRIAEACGISHPTVADLRPTGSDNRLDTRREGADGKRRPASPATQRQAIDEAIKADPEASAREVARKTGASPTTVTSRKAHLAAVPDRESAPTPTIGEMVVMAPTVWSDEPSCERSNATREFARFMDHFTRWHRRPFFDWVGEVATDCPADLKREAESVARSMSAAWLRVAEAVNTPTMKEASR